MQDRLNRDKKIDSMVSASLVVLSIQNGTFITPALMFYLIARQSYIQSKTMMKYFKTEEKHQIAIRN